MTLQLESQILWGTGLENVLTFEHPTALDNKRHWRRPAPGSERARNSAGVTDSSVTGYDYMLAGRARWFNDAAWSGGPGLEEFLTWAGRGNVFRFVPDRNAPNFYVDNVTLDEPFDDPAPDLEQADGSQAIDLVIRNPTVPFGQALRGIMFEYAPGASLTDPVAATFDRATAATYRGNPRDLPAEIGKSALSGVLRDAHYEGTLKTTLLEGARTQLVTDPENFGNWTAAGSPVRTGGQPDPFGGTAAYTVADDDGASGERISQIVAFTGDATKAIALFVKRHTPPATHAYLGLQGAAGVWRGLWRLTWSGETPVLAKEQGGVGSVAYAPETWGNGWYRLLFSVGDVVAGETNTFRIDPANNNNAAETGTLYIFRCNAWNAPFPSSSQGPSLASRSGDVFTVPFVHKPQAMFALIDFIEGGISNNEGLVGIPLAGTDPRFLLFKAGTTEYTWRLGVGGVNRDSIVTPSPTRGDRMQLLGTIEADGRIRLNYSKNFAAEVVGSQGTALALPASWATQVLGFHGWSGSFVDGLHGLVRVKVGPLTFGGVTRDTIAKAVAA